MKLVLILATIAWAQAGRLDRDYLPPKARPSPGNANFLQTARRSYDRTQTQKHFSAPVANTASVASIAPVAKTAPVANTKYTQNAYSGFEARPERAQAAKERNAAILRQDNSNDGETYSYAYETENGIFAEERGVATNGVQAQGSYSYTGDDGKVYSVRYTADENGFVPQGDHLPTPHPIPEAILRALEQNARDEAAGIFDDGSYNEVKYSAKGLQKYDNANAQPINYNRKSTTVTEKEYLPPRRQRNLRRNGF